MAELADALDLGSSGETRGGSSPPSRTFQGGLWPVDLLRCNHLHTKSVHRTQQCNIILCCVVCVQCKSAINPNEVQSHEPYGFCSASGSASTGAGMGLQIG